MSESSEPYPLDPSAERMTELVHEVARRTVEFLETLPAQPAFSNEGGEALARRLAEAPPEAGSSLESILDLLFEEVIPCSLNTAHAGYFAYVPGGGLYSAAVAEYLAAAVNRFTGLWVAAPGAVELETQVIRWLAELLGMAPGSLGVLTTGGSLSNLLAVVAARESLLGEDVHKGTFYASEQAHFCVPRAARVAGIPASNIRTIPVDGAFRMRVDRLAEAVAEDRDRGLVPFFVCASAGTVNTGTVDSLAEVADVAKAGRLWFHVDGAYGGVFRLMPELRETFAGLEQADSFAVDPHKGLFLPYGTGALLMRDVDRLGDAFACTAPYLPTDQADPSRLDFCGLTPELSRDWRGLRLWLPFKLHGIAAFRDALRQRRAMALRAFDALSADAGFEAASPPDLSLFAFRWKRGGSLAAENRYNQRVLDRVNEPRSVYLTPTTLGGKLFLRLCVLHLRTEQAHLDDALTLIRDALAAEGP